MKLSRFAKLSVLVVLLSSAAIGVNGECDPFKAPKAPYGDATIDTTSRASKTDATVTCTDGFLYNTDGYLGTSQKFTCPTTGSGNKWDPSTTTLTCIKGKVPETPWAGHFAADMAIGLVIGA
eukprot:787984_1